MSRHQKHMADMGMERGPNKYESKYEIMREITKRPSDHGTSAVYDRSDCNLRLKEEMRRNIPIR